MRVVAIDGPAGSGKTSVARALAARLGLECLDTGAMYRAVAFAVLRAGGDPSDDEFSASVARTIDLRVEADRVLVDGVDASVEIRGPSVNLAVSHVAANPKVRSEMVARQRDWARRRGGGVLEGRDIGTVVFPDAAVKVYLVADPAVRALRRARQSGLIDDRATSARPPGEAGTEPVGHSDATSAEPVGHSEAAAVESVAAELARRDLIDSTRRADPLSVAREAVVIDTTEMTLDETVEQIIALA